MIPAKYDKEQFEQAAIESGGVIATVAKRLGVHRCTIFEWRKHIPEVREILEKAVEDALDDAESRLLQAIRANELKAITYYLSTKGKSRGYTTKVENDISGTLEARGKVVVYIPDNGRDSQPQATALPTNGSERATVFLPSNGREPQTEGNQS